MTKKTIKDFDTQVIPNLPLNLRAPKEYISDEVYNLVTDMFKVVGKYRQKDWCNDIPVSEMQADVLYLQSLQATLAYHSSVIISYAEQIEDQLKIARSKVRVNSRTLKTTFEEAGNSVMITLDDIKDLSYTKTEALFEKLADAKIASEFLKFVYYSVRDHVTFLDKAVQRLYKIE